MSESALLNIRGVSWTKLTKLCWGVCSERTKGQRPVSNKININNETPNYLKKTEKGKPQTHVQVLIGPNLPHIQRSGV